MCFHTFRWCVRLCLWDNICGPNLSPIYLANAVLALSLPLVFFAFDHFDCDGVCARVSGIHFCNSFSFIRILIHAGSKTNRHRKFFRMLYIDAMDRCHLIVLVFFFVCDDMIPRSGFRMRFIFTSLCVRLAVANEDAYCILGRSVAGKRWYIY